MLQNFKLDPNSKSQKSEKEDLPTRSPETQDVYTCSSGKHENKIVEGKTEAKEKKV